MNSKVLTKWFSVVLILIMTTSAFVPAKVLAQEGDVKHEVNAESGKVSFIGPANGSVLPAERALQTSVRPEDPAMALAIQYGPAFGVNDPEHALTQTKSVTNEKGRITTRFQQVYEGIPVIGGELIVNTNQNGDLYSINGEVSPSLSVTTTPTLDAEQAKATALEVIAKWYELSPSNFTASEPELWIFDESLLRPSDRPVELVWRLEVLGVDTRVPVNELVLVNAQRGNISTHFNQVDTAWHGTHESRETSSATSEDYGAQDYQGAPGNYYAAMYVLGFPQIDTYTANNNTSLPGTFLCNETQPNCTSGVNADADAAHKYALGTYNFYAAHHNRDSIDNAGMTIVSSVNYGINYMGAFWDDDGLQMVYGNGFSLGDDVVAHEITHGVTQFESNLFYYYQSGAINESLSDIWGELYDQENGFGNDAVGVKWLLGEDSPLGVIRSLINPPAFNDPDKMTSTFYYEQTLDNGGVHTNSGVNNKAAYLMVDGATFNGKTVSAIGATKTAAIYYEAQTNLLSSGADYSDLYYALQQACTNLVGQFGIVVGDCLEVKDAIDAVEMNGQPAANFNTDAPVCTYENPVIVAADDLESGTGQWSFANGAFTRWQLDSPNFGVYAQSGEHSLYADDNPGTVTDASARWTSFVVPNNAYLHFAHAYDFEYGGGANYYDGGVLEYSINGGSSWVDAGSLMDYNGYDSTIRVYSGNNPLEGRLGFVGTSHGYISTRVNLASLATKTVHFRWRMGLDDSVDGDGWWVDNIKVYTCGAETTFADVPLNGFGWAYIESIYDAGITGGCTLGNPLLYCPNGQVTRAQMAIFLLRGIHGSAYTPPAATGTVFNDVPLGSFADAWIEQFVTEGITAGCGGNNYCPSAPVTRASMAIFLLRAKYGSGYAPPAATGTVFTDVPLGSFGDAWIEQLVAEGITGGCGANTYCPNNSVTRSQMAIFIQRTFGLTLP